MKKLLTLFVILDFIFIGIILKINSDKQRSVASAEYGIGLTDGQIQKLEIIRSLKFLTSNEQIVLSTNMLQSLCTTYAVIELKFKALNVAFSGQQPLISHSFSCDEIKKNKEQESLQTLFSDIKSMQKISVLNKETSQLRAYGIFSDEDLPNEWGLFEITVTGINSFVITEAELNKIQGENIFSFELSTF